MTVNQQLLRVESGPAGKVAILRDEYSGQLSKRIVDHVVVESGLTPADNLYTELVPHAANSGAVDYTRLLKLEPQEQRSENNGFDLYRIGDAVTGRNIHAAIGQASEREAERGARRDTRQSWGPTRHSPKNRASTLSGWIKSPAGR